MHDAENKIDVGKLSIYRKVKKKITIFFEGDEKKQKGTIASLDGIRAIACLIVVAFHLMLIMTQDIRIWSPARMPRVVTSLAYVGDTGVNLFFILSGFLLFLPFAKALLFDNAWPATWTFYLRRILRILPAYYVSLFLMIVIYHPQYLQPDHFGDLFLFLSLFMDSSSATFKQINGPFWTLAVEWQFYLFLPLIAAGIALLVRKIPQQRRLLALVGCLVVLMGWGLLTRYLGIYLTLHPKETFGLPHMVINAGLFLFYGVPSGGMHGKFMEDFAVGMVVSTLYMYTHTKGALHRSTLLLRRLSPWLFAAGLIFLGFMIAWKYNQQAPHTWHFLDPITELYQYYGQWGFGLGYGTCILAILFGAGWLRKPFEWTPLRWMGLISYGLYMWHLLLLEAFTTYVLPYISGWKQMPHLLVYGMYWGWLFVFIVPCILVLFAFVEKPAILLSDKWTRKSKRPQANIVRSPEIEQTEQPLLTTQGDK
jgi:peptidoglycan/LPS O-acetylase OafA/YrhL